MVKCGKSGCQICSLVEERDRFTNSFGKKSYIINHRFDCDSKVVVYLIQCKKCMKQYIGAQSHHSGHVLRTIGIVWEDMGKDCEISLESIYMHIFMEGHEGFK